MYFVQLGADRVPRQAALGHFHLCGHLPNVARGDALGVRVEEVREIFIADIQRAILERPRAHHDRGEGLNFALHRSQLLVHVIGDHARFIRRHGRLAALQMRDHPVEEFGPPPDKLGALPDAREVGRRAERNEVVNRLDLGAIEPLLRRPIRERRDIRAQPARRRRDFRGRADISIAHGLRHAPQEIAFRHAGLGGGRIRIVQHAPRADQGGVSRHLHARFQ